MSADTSNQRNINFSFVLSLAFHFLYFISLLWVGIKCISTVWCWCSPVSFQKSIIHRFVGSNHKLPWWSVWLIVVSRSSTYPQGNSQIGKTWPFNYCSASFSISPHHWPCWVRLIGAKGWPSLEGQTFPICSSSTVLYCLNSVGSNHGTHGVWDMPRPRRMELDLTRAYGKNGKC